MATVDQLVIELRAKTAQFEQGMDRASKTTNQFSAVAKRAQIAVAGLIGTMGAREIIQYADTYKSLSGRLALVSKDTEELAKTQENLFNIAQESRVGLESVITLYTRLSRSTKNLGYDNEQLQRVTETLSKATIISGATGIEAGNALIQLSQGLSSGALRGEEFNSVSEQLPVILEIIEKQTGKTRGELRKMAEDGQITSKLIVDAVTAAAGDIDEQFKRIPKTVSQALTTVDNAFLKYIGQSDAVAAGTGSLTSALTALAANFDTVANVVLAVGGVALVRYAAGLIPAIAGTLALNTAMLAAVGPARAMGIAMAALGGPIGIALMAVMVGAALHTNQAAEAQERYNGMLDDSRTSFKNFANASEDAKVKIINDANQRILALINEAKALDGLIEGYTRMSGSNMAGRTLGALGVGIREGAGKIGIGTAPSEVLAQRDALSKTIKEMQAMVNEPLKASKTSPAVGGAASPQTLKNQKEAIKNNKEKLQQDDHILQYNKELLKIEEERERQLDALGVAAANSFKDAVLGAESFGDAIVGLSKQIESMVFDAFVTQPLGDLFKGIVKGSGGSGGLFGDLLGGIGDIFRAEGGSVQAGMPYVVGEKRPEIFVPSTGGRIVPNMGGASGGGNSNGGGNSGGNTYIFNAPGASKHELESLKQVVIAGLGAGKIESRNMDAQRRGMA